MTRKYKKQRQEKKKLRGVIVMTCFIQIFTLTKEAVRVCFYQTTKSKNKNQEYKKRQKIKTKKQKKKLRVNAIVACVCFNVSALRKKLEGGIDNKLKERRS